MIDVNNFRNCSVLVVGDLMLDEYIYGAVNRLSPEAPVPIVNVLTSKFLLGGAGNVVSNLSSLKAKIFVIGTVGDDIVGKYILSLLEDSYISKKGVVVKEGGITTLKSRVVVDNQQMLRIDKEEPCIVSVETTKRFMSSLMSIVPIVDIILVSDYNKGVITKVTFDLISKVAKEYNRKIIVDPKGNDYSKYIGAYMLTPNQKEASIASGVDITDNSTMDIAANKIMEDSHTKNLIITQGKDGMSLYKEHTVYRIKKKTRRVFDVSGAGDTVLAVLGLALSSYVDLYDSAVLANAAAGIVICKPGTATVSVNELRNVAKKL